MGWCQVKRLVEGKLDVLQASACVWAAAETATLVGCELQASEGTTHRRIRLQRLGGTSVYPAVSPVPPCISRSGQALSSVAGEQSQSRSFGRLASVDQQLQPSRQNSLHVELPTTIRVRACHSESRGIVSTLVTPRICGVSTETKQPQRRVSIRAIRESVTLAPAGTPVRY